MTQADTKPSAWIRDEIVATPFGNLRARWTAQGLYSCLFTEDAPSATAEQSVRLQRSLDQFFNGNGFEWDLEQHDWRGVTPFHRRVLEECFSIDCGRTATYGSLATLAGSPGASRAVGVAMAKNRWPIVIPCHRVVGAGGKLTGYSGQGGLQTKRCLLDWEATIASPTQALLF